MTGLKVTEIIEGKPQEFTEFTGNLKTGSKKQHLLADLNSLNTDKFRIVVADFDNLPEGYKDFDELYQTLKDYGFEPARTPSNKVKCFHKVNFNCREIPSDAPESFLRDVYGDLMPYLDLSWSGQNRCFLTPTIVNSLTICVSGKSTQYTPKKTLKYKYEGDLPMRFIQFTNNSDDKDLFLRYLIATPKLLTGTKLNTQLLSNTVNQAEEVIASRINELMALEFLSEYEGKYYAERALKVFIESNSDKIGYCKSQLIPPAEVSILDGTWHEQLFEISKYFVSDFKQGKYGDFVAYCQGIYGIAEKDRRSKIDGIINSWSKIL